MALRSDQVRNSRYVQGGTVERFPTRLGWWERRTFASSPTDIEVTIDRKYAQRPDLMAYDAYGKPWLAWVILQYNNIVDINEEFISGKVIKLPTNFRVNTEFLTNTQNVTPI